MRCTRPADVDALKARLGPAMAALARASSAEPSALLRDWRAFLTTPAEWWTAPAELARGQALEARLAVLQGPGDVESVRDTTGPTHAVGTLLGAWTVAELADFLKAKDFEVGKIHEAAAAAAPAWKARDPAGYAAFAAALEDADRAFERARGDAETIVATIPDVLQSVTPGNVAPPGEDRAGPFDELTKASGAFTELYRRLLTEGQSPGVDMSAIPQPKGADVDLGAYKVADRATQKIEEAAKTGGSAARVVVVFAAGVLATCLLVRR